MLPEPLLIRYDELYRKQGLIGFSIFTEGRPAPGVVCVSYQRLADPSFDLKAFIEQAFSVQLGCGA